MSEVSVVFTAEDAALWNAIQRQIAAQSKLASGVDTTKSHAAAASRELARFAESTRRLVATPIERYDAAVQRLDAALAANKLTEQEHSRAIAQATAARDAAIKAADGTAQAEARAAAELDRVAANAKKLVATPIQEFEAEVAKLQAALASGRITQEEYTAAVAHHQAALDAARKAADGTAQAEARAAAELDRVAANAKKLVATPMQEFEAEVAKLQAALASGRITQEEYTAAVAHHQAALDAARKAADGTAQAEARAAAELDRVAANAKKLVATPMQEFEAEVAKLQAALASGRITQEEYTAAVAHHQAALDAARKAADGTAQAEARAAAELDRVAANAKKLVATPIQEFEAEVAKLQAALASGRITQEEYTAAVAHHQAALDAARKAADGTAQAEARAAAELDRVAANAKKLVATPMQEFEAEVAKLQAALASGRITQEEYTAAVAHHQAALDAARKAADGTAQAEARAAAEMEQFVTAAKKLSATPLQEYERTVKLAKRALDDGKISQQEFNRVQTEAKAKLESSSAGMSDFGRQAVGAGRASGALVGSVTSLAAGYVSLQTAISLANEYLTDNIKKSEEAYAAQTKLASAHETTMQNLTGLSSATKNQILTVEVPAIQARTGFPDQSTLANTIGANYSASGDMSASQNAAEAAARITLQNPDTLPKVSSGALDIGQATGIKEAERTIGMALTVGAVSRIEDPAKIAPALAPVIRSAVQDVPADQVEQVAREAAAVWALATKRANDRQGDSSSTAANTLLAKLDTFFRTQSQAFDTAKEKMTAGQSLTADERKALQAGPVVDPKTLFGRLDLFAKNPEMAQQLLGNEGFGESRFKTFLSQVITGDQATLAELRANVAAIRFDASVYEQAAKEAAVMTPQLAIATAKARADAAKQLAQLDDVDGGIAAYFRETTDEVLRRTRSDGPTGVVQFANEWNSRLWNRLTVTEAQIPKVADEQLVARRNELLRESMLPDFTDPSYGPQWDLLQQLSRVGIDKPGHLTQQDLRKAGVADEQVIQRILLIEQQLQINEDLQRSGDVRQRLIVPPRQPASAVTVPLSTFGLVPTSSAVPPLRAPLSSLLNSPAPAASAAPTTTGVSPENNQAAALGNAGQDLVRALKGVAEQIRSITVQQAPQIAAAPKRKMIPDYSGRARREQAFAAG